MAGHTHCHTPLFWLINTDRQVVRPLDPDQLSSKAHLEVTGLLSFVNRPLEPRDTQTCTSSYWLHACFLSTVFCMFCVLLSMPTSPLSSLPSSLILQINALVPITLCDTHTHTKCKSRELQQRLNTLFSLKIKHLKYIYVFT